MSKKITTASKKSCKNTHGCHSLYLIIQFFSMLFCCFPNPLLWWFMLVSTWCAALWIKFRQTVWRLKKNSVKLLHEGIAKKSSSNCSNDIKQSDNLTRFYPSYFIILFVASNHQTTNIVFPIFFQKNVPKFEHLKKKTTF